MIETILREPRPHACLNILYWSLVLLDHNHELQLGIYCPFYYENNERKRLCLWLAWLTEFRRKTRVFVRAAASSPSHQLLESTSVDHSVLGKSRIPPVCQTNMENRKRPLDAVFTSNGEFKTPEKRTSVARRQQYSDYMQWGVEETCQYLRSEGLEKWENAFRGSYSGLEAWIDSAPLFCDISRRQRINWYFVSAQHKTSQASACGISLTLTWWIWA